MKKKILLLSFLLLILILSIFLFSFWRTKDFVSQRLYDLTHPQNVITTQKSIDSVLAQFELIPFQKLDKNYLRLTRSDESKYQRMLKGKQYFLINGMDIYQNIAGTIRIKDLLPKDSFYKSHVLNFNKSKGLYWLVNKQMLYKMVELQAALKSKGFNEKALVVRNGFRHPSYNEKVGGASRSRHIAGEAIDFNVRDINRDGKTNQADKTIVLDLLEKRIIKHFGGIGRYPGTLSVHFDVRGHHARWDSY